MAKKDFKASITGVDAFFSTPAAAEPAAVEESAMTEAPTPVTTPVQPVTADEPRGRGKPGRDTYVFTLHLPKQWKDIISDAAWERRMSVTGLLVQIIGDWLKAQKKI